MLFCDILVVRADQSASSSSVISGTVTADGISNWQNVNGSLHSGSGSITGPYYTNTSGHFHFEYPIDLSVPRSSLGIDTVNNIIIVYGAFGDFIISGSAIVQNVYIKDINGDIVRSIGTSGNSYTHAYIMRKGDFIGVDGSKTHLPFYVCGDAYFENKAQLPVQYDSNNNYTVTSKNFTISVPWTVFCRDATESESANYGSPVYDSGTSQQLQTLNNSSQAIEQSVTSETGSGILATIKSFFGSFFSNLIGIFVPEDGYFSNWFTRLNTLLADKLGMLYAPFDLLIQVLTSIMNADSSFAGIPFPGIQWEDTWLVEPFTFNFSSLGDVYTDLQGYVYFGTDVLLLIAFFGLLQDKIKHILED